MEVGKHINPASISRLNNKTVPHPQHFLKAKNLHLKQWPQDWKSHLGWPIGPFLRTLESPTHRPFQTDERPSRFLKEVPGISSLNNMASKNLCPTAKSPGVQGREKLIGKRFVGGFCLMQWIINWNTGSPWHFKMNYISLKRQSRKWKEASDPPLLIGKKQTEVTQVQSQFSFRRMTSKGTTRAPRAGATENSSQSRADLGSRKWWHVTKQISELLQTTDWGVLSISLLLNGNSSRGSRTSVHRFTTGVWKADSVSAELTGSGRPWAASPTPTAALDDKILNSKAQPNYKLKHGMIWGRALGRVNALCMWEKWK